MKKVTQLRSDNTETDSQDQATRDELDQVRELLFGGTVRDIEKQRDALQKEVNAGFAESDRQTNKRLDELTARLEQLKSALEEEARRVDQKISAESARVDKAFAQGKKDLETASSRQHADLEASVASERARMADALRNLASIIANKSD